MSGAAIAPVSELVTRVRRWVDERPDAIAVQVGGRAPRAATYREMAASVDETVAALARAGVRPGMRTVLLVFPGLELGVLAVALLRLGAVPVLADPGMPYGAVGRCLNAAGPEAFVGIPLAQAARLALGWGRAGRVRVTVGSRLWPGPTIAALRAAVRGSAERAEPGAGRDDGSESGFHTGRWAGNGIAGGDRKPHPEWTGGRADDGTATNAESGNGREARQAGNRPADASHARCFRERNEPTGRGESGGQDRVAGSEVAGRADGPVARLPPPSLDDLAVIAYTSGSTGPPKGVPLRHRHLAAQLDLLGPLDLLRPGAPMLSTFAPFTLGAAAFGATAVIPDIDPRRPMRADPASLVTDIQRYGVETVFAAPALLDRLARHCVARRLTLDSVRVVAVAGAPLPLPTLRRVRACLPPGARVLSVYGATECLPVAAIDGDDLAAAWELAGGGKPTVGEAGTEGTGGRKPDARETGGGEAVGTCLGVPLPGTFVRVIAVTDLPIPCWHDDLMAPPGTVGEIVVASPAVSDPYLDDPAATALARIADGDRIWHRMGDLGHFDERGRLWFAGRKSERVRTADGDLYTDHVETVFATVPGVRRTALVGVGPPGAQRPVLVVEREPGARRADVRTRLLERAARHPRATALHDVLFHARLPVDARHNSKIRRAELAAWAARRLRRGRR